MADRHEFEAAASGLCRVCGADSEAEQHGEQLDETTPPEPSAGSGWHALAVRAFDELIASGKPFTSDELLAACGHPDETHPANGRNSAIGSLFGQASRDGRIEAVGTRHSTSPERKRGMVRIWRGVRPD